jgi:uncharacterized membrane protein YkvA (DUF1232 family)
MPIAAPQDDASVALDLLPCICSMISVQSYARKLRSEVARLKETQPGRDWKCRASHYLRKACVMYLVMKDPRSPILAKAIAALSVGYLFSPIQLIPSFIPVLGWLDDIAVLSAGMWLVNRLTPKEIILQSQANAIALRAKWLPAAAPPKSLALGDSYSEDPPVEQREDSRNRPG